MSEQKETDTAQKSGGKALALRKRLALMEAELEKAEVEQQQLVEQFRSGKLNLSALKRLARDVVRIDAAAQQQVTFLDDALVELEIVEALLKDR